MYENAVNAYQQTRFFTANPLKLVLLCYAGAIDNLKLARDAYAARDYETKGRALQKTLDIIHELNAALDIEKGGVVARNLRALYLYLTQFLTEADLKKDIAAFDDALKILKELESAWKTVAREAGRDDAPAPYAAAIPAAKTAYAAGRV